MKRNQNGTRTELTGAVLPAASDKAALYARETYADSAESYSVTLIVAAFKPEPEMDRIRTEPT